MPKATTVRSAQTTRSAQAPRSAQAARPRKTKRDAALEAAQEQAREALLDVARPDAVGEYAGFRLLDERLGVHEFHTTEPGYVGWRWAVSVARVPRGRHATICEIDLLPADGALLAPEWVPWEDRLLPEDISRDDVLPYRAEDARLDQGYEATGVDADEQLTDELGLGRPRVLSAKGRAEAIKRWYASSQGPKPGRQPKAMCSTCGFLVKLSGSLRTVFGVCANVWAADDGRVVSLDHTCGSHSETDVPRRESEWPVRPSRVNDFQVESSPMLTPAQAEQADSPVKSDSPVQTDAPDQSDSPEQGSSAEPRSTAEQNSTAVQVDEAAATESGEPTEGEAVDRPGDPENGSGDPENGQAEPAQATS